jgi:phospholipid/cholesterol/gamma-HCH transport system substrate-binding protein
VRIAGLDTGNVVDLDVVENRDGTLRAKVRISLPAKLVKKLRQDVKVTVQPALTGMSHINIVSSGHSNVPLVPGQDPILGTETSLFEPIIDHIGLGAAERTDIRHMIAAIRETVDSAAPRVRQSLASLAETSANVKEMSDSLRPAIESTVGEIEQLARRIRANAPRIESTLVRVDEMTGDLQGIVAENRESVRQTLASVRDLTASLTDIVGKDRLKVERLLDGLDVMRLRTERVLYQAEQVAGQVSAILTRGRAEIERSITNVRDATDWANRLVQKLFANPFVLSPLYKPNHEDLRVTAAFDVAVAFSKGAQELHDAAKTLEMLAARPANPQQQQEIQKLEQEIARLNTQLTETSHRLFEAIRQSNGRERVRR